MRNAECGITAKHYVCRNPVGDGVLDVPNIPTNVTISIRTSKASADDVVDGSRLPTRSNRKTIATGNLRPRRPEHTNKYR